MQSFSGGGRGKMTPTFFALVRFRDPDTPTLVDLFLPNTCSSSPSTWYSLKLSVLHTDDIFRKLPSWARAHSSTHGCLTSLRPSVSVVSPSTLPSGNSRLPGTMSPSSVGFYLIFWYSPANAKISSQTLPVTVISSRT